LSREGRFLKRFRDYTVLLVPDHTSKVHRIRLSARKISALIISCGGLIFLLVVFGANFLVNLRTSSRLSKVQTENEDLKVQLRTLTQQMGTVQNQLNRVSELDHKIRLATGLEIDQNALMGAGGPESDGSSMSLMLPPDEASQVRKIASKLSQIDAILDNQELSLEELDSYFADNESLITATPSIWPSRGLVTSEFGVRASLFHTGTTVHEGIDIAAPPGTLIRAAADGIVTFANWESGYGNLVVISHGYGLVTRYGHCSGFMVREGQSVKRGQLIATVGSTGQATGPHLHYEVIVHGIKVNPRKYIFE